MMNRALLLASVLLLASCVSSPVATPPQPQPQTLEIYDVDDISKSIPAPGLADLVTRNVLAAWDAGESIREENGMLVVRQTAAAQGEIRKFLGVLRRYEGTLVSVDVTVIDSLTDDFLGNLGMEPRDGCCLMDDVSVAAMLRVVHRSSTRITRRPAMLAWSTETVETDVVVNGQKTAWRIRPIVGSDPKQLTLELQVAANAETKSFTLPDRGTLCRVDAGGLVLLKTSVIKLGNK